MRTGLLFGGIDLTPPQMAEIARQAELAGMDGIYCVEAYRNGLVPLAAIAAATRRVAVGPYVLNAYFRTPLAAGLAGLDLDEIAAGRLVMAVGSGNAHITRHWLGERPVSPLGKMTDYVHILRAVMRAAPGERVVYHGEVHTIDWTQQVPRREGPGVPLYLAAIFPKMLRLAAAIADGVALGAMTSPAYLARTIRPALAESAASVGRAPGQLGVKVCTMIAVNPDRRLAAAAARRAVAGVFAAHPHPYYEHMLREQGFAPQLEACLGRLAAGDFDGAAAVIDDAVIDSAVVWGTPEDCAARLAAYLGLADEVVMTDVGASAVPGDPTAGYRALLEIARMLKV